MQTLKQNKLRHALSCCNVLSDRGDPDQGNATHVGQQEGHATTTVRRLETSQSKSSTHQC